MVHQESEIARLLKQEIRWQAAVNRRPACTAKKRPVNIFLRWGAGNDNGARILQVDETGKVLFNLWPLPDSRQQWPPFPVVRCNEEGGGGK